MNLVAVFDGLNAAGARLVFDGDTVRVRAKKGALDVKTVELLRASRDDLVTLLTLDLPGLLDALPLEEPTGALYGTAITASGYTYSHSVCFDVWPPSLEDMTRAGARLLDYVRASEIRTAALFAAHPPSKVVRVRLDEENTPLASTPGLSEDEVSG